MATERIDFDETSAQPIAGRIDFDEAGAAPLKQIGGVESAIRTVKDSARKGLQLWDGLATGLASIFSEEEATRVAGMGVKREEALRGAGWQGEQLGEEFSTPGAVVGGIASIPTEVLGGFGAQHGFERGKEVLERGGTMEEAQKAAAVTGAARAGLNLLPIKVGGKVGQAIESKVGGALGGVATGAGVSAAGGVAARTAENAALPEGEQFQDLRQESDLKTIATDAAMGAVFGGGAGAVASRRARKAKAKADAEAANAFPVDKMEDLGDGNFRAPNGSTITKEAWDGASERVRKGWLEKAEEPREPTLPDEIDRISEEHPTGPVADVVNKVRTEREKTARTKADAAELRRAAEQTTDIEIKRALNKQADKLDPPEKVPAGEVREGQPEIKTEQPKKLPVGEVREGQPEIKTEQPKKIPAGEVIEEKIPVGETDEIPGTGGKIPVGEAREVTASGVESTAEPKPGSIPAGEARELYVPPEKRNAAQEVSKQEGVQPERGEGDEGRPAAEAGAGNRVQRAAEGEKEALDLGLPPIDESMITQAKREPLITAKAPSKRELKRGYDAARSAIEKGKADKSIDPDGADLALWALDKNPGIARNLHVSIEEPRADGARGAYNPAQRIVRAFKGQDNAQTLAHEIFHHSERMMPLDVQRGIRKEWRRNYERELRNLTGVQREVLADVPKMMAGDADARKRIMDAFKGGVLDKAKHYHLVDPSEFWAVNAARILNERFTSRGTWRAKAVQWMREFVEKAKSTIGMRSDAPVLKAIDEILNPQRTSGRSKAGQSLAKAETFGELGDREQLDIGGGKRALPEETGMQKAERKLFDRFNRVAQLQKTEAPKSEVADIYTSDKLFQGRAQHRGDVLERDFIKPLGKQLEAAKKLKLTVKDADDYVMALHAPERNAEIARINPKMRDGGSGLTNKQAKDIIASFTPEQRTALDGIAKTVQDMNKVKLKGLLDDGLITKDLHDTLTRKYKNYVPLKTLDDEAEFIGVGQGYSMRATDITEALGRSSKASSPIAASMMDAARSIIRGEKARVDRSIWEYAQNKEAHDFIKPYDPDKPPPEVMGRKKGPDGQVRPVVDPKKVKDLTIDLVIDGQQQKVFVPDQLLRDQIKKLATMNDPGQILGGLGKVTSTIGRMLTEFNPAFIIPNAVRDAITVGMRSKAHGISPASLITGIPNAWKAIASYKRGANTPDAKMYEEFLRSGGKTGAYGVTDLADTMKRLEAEGAKLGYDKMEGGAIRKTKNVLKSAAKVVSSANEVMEYAARFHVYRALREKGQSPRQAASAAKEVTVNFNRSGEYGRALNSAFVFANAALQGLRNMGVYAKNPSVQRGMIGIMALGPAVQAYNEMVGGMNEETGEPNINSQNDSITDRNLVLLVPGSKEGIKIPLPPEYSWLYALGRRAYRAFSQGDVKKEAAGMFGNVLDATLPVRLPEADSAAGSVGKALVITAAAPFVDIWDNKNYFGQTIVPETYDKTSPPPFYKISRSTTSDITKAISEGLNTVTGGDVVTPGASQKVFGALASPEGIEHLVGYYTGGVGQFAMQSKNLAKSVAQGKDVDRNKVPILNRFMFEEPKSYTSRRYKELAPEFEYARDYQKAGTPEKIDPKIVRALDEFTVAEKQLRNLFKQLRGAANDEEKEQIQAEIKATQARVIKAYNGQQ